MRSMQTTTHSIIADIALAHYPAIQGIYLFGSYGTENQWPTSDVDIALLLPHAQAGREKHLNLSPCCLELESALRREVDLVNLRQVNTVFQKEVIAEGRLIFCADTRAQNEFEMLVISYYQKLNEERREILEAFFRTGRAYAV
jgi:predicted nucleotidyltransferase